VLYYYYYEMVWIAVDCNYSSNFSGDFLCSLSLRNLLFLFTNYIFFIPLVRFFRIRQRTHVCGLTSSENYCPRSGTWL